MVVILYWIIGYWAVGKTIYANRIILGSWNQIVIQRMVWALILGWLLIPIAILKVLIMKCN